VTKTNRIRAVVYLSGGCFEGYDSEHPVEIEPFDWDDFNSEPITYWNDLSQEAKDVIKTNECVSQQIQDTLDEAYKEQAEQNDQDNRKADAIREMN
jgi:hypothetical protein